MKSLVSLVLFCVAAVLPVSATELGLSLGYLVDAEEAMVNAHIGFDLPFTATAADQAEFEIGYTRMKDSGVSMDILPFMANYRLTLPVGKKVDFNAKAGLGQSRVKVSVPALGVADDDMAFSYQAYLGFAFHPVPDTSLTLGARYLWIGEIDLFGFKSDVGDDVSIELGWNVRF